MNKNIKATNIELTESISNYLEKRFSGFEKFINPNDTGAICDIEVGKVTQHHRSGDIFRAEVNLHIAGKGFYAASEKEDLYSAIDEVRDEVMRSLKSHKEKKITLTRKGASKFKDIIRGFSDWRNK